MIKLNLRKASKLFLIKIAYICFFGVKFYILHLKTRFIKLTIHNSPGTQIQKQKLIFSNNVFLNASTHFSSLS